MSRRKMETETWRQLMAIRFAFTLQQISKMGALFGPQFVPRFAFHDAKSSAAKLPPHHQIEVQDRPPQKRSMNLRIA